MKYHIPKNQARSTLFGNDAEVSDNGTNLRPRTFEWNIALPSANFVHVTTKSIESIFCRYERAVVTGLVGVQVMAFKKSGTGGVYQDNEPYETSSAGGGVCLKLANTQHTGTINDIFGKNIIVSNGSGCVVNSNITVLDANAN